MKKRLRTFLKLPVFHLFRSIQTAMMFWFSLIILAALIIFLLVSLQYTQKTVVENSSDYTMQLVSQVNKDIDSYIEYMQNISLMFSNNSDVQNYVSATYTTSSMGTVEWVRIAKLFGNIMDARSDICNIGLIVDDGRNILNYGYDDMNKNIDLGKLNWYQESRKAKGQTVLSNSHVQTLIKDRYQWVITLSNTLSDTITNEPRGVFFIDLNYKAINDLCKGLSLGSKGYVFILSSNGEIIYHPKQQLIYSGLKTEEIDKVMALKGASQHFIVKDGNDSKLYTACTSKETGWTVVGVSFMSDMMAEKQHAQEIYTIVALLLLFLTLILSMVISSGITRPVRVLQKSMSKVELGNFEEVVLDDGNFRELTSLGKSFNVMTFRIQRLMEENIEEQRQKRKSELHALQAQINPHFLYNTLDSIIWMSEMNKNKEVILMTSSLAKLLRQSISNLDELVTIQDELDYTRTYLTIQKMRYQDKLEFYIDVDDEILMHPVIKLVLQPLVENALYHGIKYKDGIGIIYISGEPEADCIALHVDDNGLGMDAETLAHIFDKKPDQTGRNGVAVNNIQRRLQLYYGPEYGLSYESSPETGTIVTIRIPYQSREDMK